MYQVSIRRAEADDAELLARIGAETFTQTFAAVNTPEDMREYLASAFSTEIQAAELRNSAATFLIASIDGEAAGYAKLDETVAPDDVAGERPVELVRFYVEARWHGRGVSHSLMKEVVSAAIRAGYDVIWLGVWEMNPRAIAFYKKWGFEVVGKKSFKLGADVQTDLVMTRALE
ncbi:MAG TPA: GNAT family N-acetyltransferase [Blastocatellia bacterium]|nr:GNAT family N-acetyltransferase [Blastocatellia bacterium]